MCPIGIKRPQDEGGRKREVQPDNTCYPHSTESHLIEASGETEHILLVLRLGVCLGGGL